MKLCVSSLEHTYKGVLILIPIVFFNIIFFLLVLCVDILRVARVFCCHPMSLICHLCFAIQFAVL